MEAPVVLGADESSASNYRDVTRNHREIEKLKQCVKELILQRAGRDPSYGATFELFLQ
jgi:hypothetical protein